MPHSSSSPNPRIQGFILGPWETNCYLIDVPRQGSDNDNDSAANHRECWIIDAGFEPAPLIDAVRKSHFKPVRLILTHAHVDHVAGVREILDAFGDDLPIAIHSAEARFPADPMLNLSAFLGMDLVAPDPTQLLSDGDILELDGTHWTVIHTPGHSPGGITLYHAPSATAIVGDTLFNGSIGRSDFPTSDPRTLTASIRNRLYTLPDETRVYPGHGPTTTIGREKRTNPFVTA